MVTLKVPQITPPKMVTQNSSLQTIPAAHESKSQNTTNSTIEKAAHFNSFKSVAIEKAGELNSFKSITAIEKTGELNSCKSVPIML